MIALYNAQRACWDGAAGAESLQKGSLGGDSQPARLVIQAADRAGNGIVALAHLQSQRALPRRGQADVEGNQVRHALAQA